MPTIELRAKLLVDLSSELRGLDEPVTFCVGTGGEILAAGRTAHAEQMETRGFARFPKSRLDSPTEYWVVRWQDGKVVRTTLRDEWLPISYVQPLGEELLLVSARCRWTPEGVDQNAAICDQTGRVRHRFTLGDGIQDVRTAADGAIWVSFFDEGIFGSFGWGGPGPEPLGAPGVVAFDRTGQRKWAFDASAARTDSICDAYALNVAGSDDAWVYFYTEFPIVRVRHGEYRVWETEVAGARALAADDERVLLFGGYNQGERSAARILDLRRGEAHTLATARFVSEQGAILVPGEAMGVGPKLYLRQAHRMYVVEDRWRALTWG